eukprot:629413-Hanusia_phi.AAC.1
MAADRTAADHGTPRPFPSPFFPPFWLSGCQIPLPSCPVRASEGREGLLSTPQSRGRSGPASICTRSPECDRTVSRVRPGPVPGQWGIWQCQNQRVCGVCWGTLIETDTHPSVWSERSVTRLPETVTIPHPAVNRTPGRGPVSAADTVTAAPGLLDNCAL